MPHTVLPTVLVVASPVIMRLGKYSRSEKKLMGKESDDPPDDSIGLVSVLVS